MRISDWSSDVCSSDLRDAARAGRNGCVRARATRRRSRVGRRPRANRGGCRGRGRRDGSQDRKSVVEGKSVSVRVDLGGRRIIKKKTRREERSEYIQETRTEQNTTQKQQN